MTTYQPFAAGQRLTAGDLDAQLMIGLVVFRAYRGTSQNISTGAESASNALSWDSVDLDRLGAWSAGSPTRWTCPQTGWWTVSGAISFSGSTGGSTRDACWFVNGTLVAAGRARTFAESSIVAQSLTVEARTLPQFLAAGDYVELVPAQDTGGNLAVAVGSFRPYISITYSGPS